MKRMGKLSKVDHLKKKEKKKKSCFIMFVSLFERDFEPLFSK